MARSTKREAPSEWARPYEQSCEQNGEAPSACGQRLDEHCGMPALLSLGHWRLILVAVAGALSRPLALLAPEISEFIVIGVR